MPPPRESGGGVLLKLKGARRMGYGTGGRVLGCARAPAWSLQSRVGSATERMKGGRSMKAVVNNFMQLLLIIMSLVTLAVSTAAVSMFLG